MGKPPPPIDAENVREFLKGLFEQDVHARRILSIANATLGVIHAASLSVHAIGLGLARAEGLESKHAIKQVDRLLSNPGVNVWALFAQWVPFLLARDRRS